MKLPANWMTALQAICEAPTSLLQESVFCHSPVGWKRREMVRKRYKRPDLIVLCFDFWLHGTIPVFGCPPPEL